MITIEHLQKSFNGKPVLVYNYQRVAPPPGERLVRLCFAKEDATLVAAAERLSRL